MAYAGLFLWWIITITWSIAFPIAVSIFLYARRKTREAEGNRRRFQSVRDFAFVWFLLGLLVFYIFVVGRSSSFLFAVGNIAFEAVLLLYAVASTRRTKAGGSVPETESQLPAS